MKNERKDEIIRLISENRMVKAQDLSKQFGVSMETVRRDLADLEKNNIIRRVHGGAVLNLAHSMEPDFSYREINNFEEKVMIGKKAVSFVENGETIIIDIGTTTLEFSRFLKGQKKVNVLTNSMKIAFELMDDPDITVIMLGGFVRDGEGTTSGFWAEEMVDKFQVDKVFLGVGALNTEHGIMDYDISETNLRRHYIEHAKEVVALADFSKFGISALNEVCPVGKITQLITDEKADKRILKELKEKGVRVTIV